MTLPSSSRSTWNPCPRCMGSGQRRGMMSTSTCSTCDGTGKAS